MRFQVADGQFHRELLVVEYALCDVGAEDGGLCVVPGSHKSNFACPESFAAFEKMGPWLKHIPQPAGSVVIFAEALTHGTLPRTADHERRALFYRYTPGHMAFVGRYREDGREMADGGYPQPAPSAEGDWSRQERRILEAPYLWKRADTIGQE
jgi:ectoine hydroxylase-related dioxygenase (phytanoyl-CoA dioxygenase family)